MQRTTRGDWPALVRLICLALAVSNVQPAAAGDASAIGPCSPIADPDGDIRSELPGCGWHGRPQPGSLDDEMAFRRNPRAATDGAEPPHRRNRHATPDVDPEE